MQMALVMLFCFFSLSKVLEFFWLFLVKGVFLNSQVVSQLAITLNNGLMWMASISYIFYWVFEWSSVLLFRIGNLCGYSILARVLCLSTLKGLM